MAQWIVGRRLFKAFSVVLIYLPTRWSYWAQGVVVLDTLRPHPSPRQPPPPSSLSGTCTQQTHLSNQQCREHPPSKSHCWEGRCCCDGCLCKLTNRGRVEEGEGRYTTSGEALWSRGKPRESKHAM
ncbi:hypothetical protein BDD12DRAFT_476720 [Trichophaea hybrida]|nr:hypothetical protein BDD12DRAFT_476720 [Trichophaea hybrida]